LFFKIAHKDRIVKSHKLLTNRDQEKVIDFLIELISKRMRECKRTNDTKTVVPVYDSSLKKDKVRFLQQVKMAPIC
jgi:hypothetical protein